MLGMKSATSLLQIIVYTTLYFGTWLVTLQIGFLSVITTDLDKAGCSCRQS